jgi:hypothetical protein
MNSYYDIECDTCDTCRKYNIGVMHFHLGTPVLFLCRDCQPKAFTPIASLVVFTAVLESLFDFDSCATDA